MLLLPDVLMSAAPTPAVEGLSPSVSDLLGQPDYVLERRDGVTTWFYEIDGPFASSPTKARLR